MSRGGHKQAQHESAGRANAVAPGVIFTPMADRAGPTSTASPVHARALAMHPMARLGAPEEVAQAVLRLCSKNASFTTGDVIPVDGGCTIP
jgi:NAD(P)-dependent dehydrogenase (short-subunit alcohol dehydrogenase family)